MTKRRRVERPYRDYGKDARTATLDVLSPRQQAAFERLERGQVRMPESDYGFTIELHPPYTSTRWLRAVIATVYHFCQGPAPSLVETAHGPEDARTVIVHFKDGAPHKAVIDTAYGRIARHLEKGQRPQ